MNCGYLVLFVNMNWL